MTMTMNRIFTDNLLKKIKTKSGTDCTVMSWKGLALMLAMRCAELEVDFRKLEDEIRTKKRQAINK